MKPLLTFLILSIILCSCRSITGSGNIKTQTRSLSQFKGVKSSGSIDIEVMNHQSQTVKVEADDNILPYIITSVEDGILNVHLKSNISYRKINAKIYVNAPVLQKLLVSGSGSINSKTPLTEDEQIELKVSGSGDINAFVDAPSIAANISGSGAITLNGRTKNFNCKITGSGNIKCGELLSENTTAKITGSGTAHVFASVQLVAKVTGSGSIFYKGNPPSPQIQKSGSGSVQAEK